MFDRALLTIIINFDLEIKYFMILSINLTISKVYYLSNCSQFSYLTINQFHKFIQDNVSIKFLNY